MKNLSRLAVTLGIGSALAWIASSQERKKKIREKGKTVLARITGDKYSDDDNKMRYI